MHVSIRENKKRAGTGMKKVEKTDSGGDEEWYLEDEHMGKCLGESDPRENGQREEGLRGQRKTESRTRKEGTDVGEVRVCKKIKASSKANVQESWFMEEVKRSGGITQWQETQNQDEERKVRNMSFCWGRH